MCVVTNGLNVLQNNGEVRIHLKLAIISIDSLHSTLYDSCFLYFLTSRLNKKMSKIFLHFSPLFQSLIYLLIYCLYLSLL